MSRSSCFFLLVIEISCSIFFFSHLYEASDLLQKFSGRVDFADPVTTVLFELDQLSSHFRIIVFTNSNDLADRLSRPI